MFLPQYRLPCRTPAHNPTRTTLGRAAGALALALICLAGGARNVAGQGEKKLSRTEVTKLTITGVKSVDAAELKQNIATDESHCNSFLLRPFCVVSKSPTFYSRTYLDHDELARDVLRMRVFYFKRGYRDAEVDTTVTPDGKNAAHVTLAVREGKPTIVDSLDVEQTARVLSPRAIRRRLALRKGNPLDLFKLDSTVTSLKNRVWDRGYSDAKIDTAVIIDSATKAATVKIDVDPRWKSRVVSIEVQGNKQITTRTIDKSLSFKPGDLYKQSVVLNSQRTLYESNLFRRASISVPAEDDSLKHVVVAVQEAPTHDALYSLGFTTVEFVQAQAQYTDYNWFGGAKRLTLSGTLGNLFANQLNGNGIFYDVGKNTIGGSEGKYLAPTYTTSADLRYPWFGSPNNEIALGIFAHRRSSPGIYVDRGYGLSGTFTRKLAPRAPASLNYRYEVTNTDAGDVYFCVNYGVCDAPTLSALRSKQRLSPLALTVSVDNTDNPFEPRRGYRGQFDAEDASTYTFSDFRYNRIEGEGAVFIPFGRRNVIAGHIRAGYVSALKSTLDAVGVGDSSDAIAILHPRKRFYAGGANSVRGFAESQLGPRVLTVPAAKLLANDPNCTAATIATCNPDAAKFQDRDFEPRPLGGNQLVEASAEFRFPLFGNLIGATFVDGAYLAQNTSPSLPKGKGAVTPGFGVRYLSSVGPIRVDVGINPVTTEKLQVVTEDLANGGSGLVTLNTKRTYSPSQGNGGINNVLSRLTLHLSIGEAY